MTGELKKRDRLQAFFMSIFFDASVAEFTVRNAAFPDKAGPTWLLFVRLCSVPHGALASAARSRIKTYLTVILLAPEIWRLADSFLSAQPRDGLCERVWERPECRI
jgi:hypothetical protein